MSTPTRTPVASAILPEEVTTHLASEAGSPTPASAAPPESQSSDHQTPPNDAQRKTRKAKPETSVSAEYAPPRIGEPHLRRYRLRWSTFKRFCRRPVTMDPELLDQVYDTIEHYGVSDARAALLLKLCPSTIDRWKEEDPDLWRYFETARAEFELEQIHHVRSFTRKDGKGDPHCARWLLERTNPEMWGRPSARRTAASKHETRNSKRESAPQDAPPKPGTPAYWDHVEEEPFPRNTSTCIITPGMQKFYSILHLTESRYIPAPNPADPQRDQRSARETPEQRAAKNESFFHLQERYFSLPKEERLPFLHQLFEQQYGRVLSPAERAAADALVAGPSSSPAVPSSPSPSSSPSFPKSSSPAVESGPAGTPPSAHPPATPLASATEPAPGVRRSAVVQEKQPSDYTQEERVALFHQLVWKERERLMREAQTFFSNADDNG